MEQAHQRERGQRRALGAALSLACHALVVLALMSVRSAPQPIAPQPITVELVRPPAPLAVEAPKAAGKPKRAKPAARARTPVRRVARPKPAPPRVLVTRHTPQRPRPSAIIAEAPAPVVAMPSLSESELAGAVGADAADEGDGGSGGGGGGGCHMAQRVQAALRQDALAQAAVAGLAGKAVRVWDGDWVWMPGEVGKGLAAVRQTIMWEIAFAPAACRSQAMRGMVLFSLDGPDGRVRLAVGAGAWRWSDLLTPHPGMGGWR